MNGCRIGRTTDTWALSLQGIAESLTVSCDREVSLVSTVKRGSCPVLEGIVFYLTPNFLSFPASLEFSHSVSLQELCITEMVPKVTHLVTRAVTGGDHPCLPFTLHRVDI